jgi:glutamate racemase
VGVVEPGAQAALAASGNEKNKDVLVLATAATVQSGAYTRALAALGLPATEKACPLLVPLVEEGWLEQPVYKSVTLEVLRIYLIEALAEAPKAATLLLGCTHYPLLKPLLETTLQTLRHPLTIIDSADATARAVQALVPAATAASEAAQHCEFYATDSVDKFQRLGSIFLGRPLDEVHLLDLGG